MEHKKKIAFQRIVTGITLTLFIVTLICSCSSPLDNPKSTATPTPKQPRAAVAPNKESIPPLNLKVKGFYLGMPVDEAVKSCHELGCEKNCKPKGNGEIGNYLDCIHIRFSMEGQANLISFNKKPFGAEAMTEQEFAQKFMDSYGIPGLQTIVRGITKSEYRQYISPSGLRVIIHEGIQLDEVEKARFN